MNLLFFVINHYQLLTNNPNKFAISGIVKKPAIIGNPVNMAD
jgi:hypothetical protein